MKSIVVYESHWGNTAAVARAIAEGIGPEASAMSTDEANAAAIANTDLIVAGAPLLGFSLPTEAMLQNIARSAATNSVAPDVSHPSLRSWLDALPNGSGHAAAFETRIWWSPGSAAKTILGKLDGHGYRPAGPAQRFVVQGRYGPLREGELARAKAWGAELARVCVPELGR